MTIYKNYIELTDSPLLDKGLIACGKYSITALLVFILFAGPFNSVFPILILLSRQYILDHKIKAAISYFSIIWTFITGSRMWSMILLNIELIRLGLKYGVPYIMKKIGQKIDKDPISETLLKRLFSLSRDMKLQPLQTSAYQLYLYIICYKNKDISQAFNDDEFAKFKKFFSNFEDTHIIIGKEYDSVTLFFPSFILRLSKEGFQLTTDEAIKLLENIPQNEICTVCRETLSDTSVELKCKHLYCLNCIFSWLNQQYTCPTCRTIVL